MKIFRPEPFGGVLFETKDLRFSLVTTNVEADRILPAPKQFLRTDIISSPVRVYYELTRKCNLTCGDCFVSASPNGMYGLDTTSHQSILDTLAQNRVIDIRFTGGEPTQRTDWFRILQHAKNLGFALSLNTNGVYDHLERTIEQLVELQLEQVTISIDGICEHHDRIRGQGSYDRAIDALNMMHEAGLPTRINTVITKINQGDINAMVELAAKYSQEINFFHMRPVGRGRLLAGKSLTFEEHYQSAQEAIALRTRFPQLSIMHFEQSYRERSIQGIQTGLPNTLSHGNTTLNIDCEGGIWPNGYNTYQDRRLLLGNMLTDDFEQVWNNNPTLNAFRKWQDEILQHCQACEEYLQRCPGLSPEMEIATTQGMHNNFCISELPMPQLFGKHTP